MAALKDQLRSDLTAALKARDSLKASVIRMALTAITNAEVAGKEARELTDEDVIGVLSTEAKKRKESAEAFDAGNRPELAQKERDEAVILAQYLPEPLSEEEISRIIADAISQTGATAMSDMGKVMGIVTPQTKGRADGAAIAAEVRKQLG